MKGTSFKESTMDGSEGVIPSFRAENSMPAFPTKFGADLDDGFVLRP